jgi:hypothetical protein
LRKFIWKNYPHYNHDHKGIVRKKTELLESEKIKDAKLLTIKMGDGIHKTDSSTILEKHLTHFSLRTSRKNKAMQIP